VAPTTITSFDLFGTLVDARRPDDPAAAVAAELAARDVPVPADWAAAFREYHLDLPDGVELSLPEHAVAALESRDVELSDVAGTDEAGNALVHQAVLEAYDPPTVTTREDAAAAVRAAAAVGPVGVLSNCTVPKLVPRVLARSDLDLATFDAVVSSVECGWRKPHRLAFETVAERLDGTTEDLVHVGDDPLADGGAEAAGATCHLIGETSLADLPAVFGDAP